MLKREREGHPEPEQRRRNAEPLARGGVPYAVAAPFSFLAFFGFFRSLRSR